MRLLLVEDSPSLRASLSEGLRRSGYVLDAVADGKAGLIHARTTDYDAILLDIMLPELDGLSLLRQIRAKGQKTPVLFLTARDTTSDRIIGLRAGGDDYLIKPFDFDELLARIQALIRRSHGSGSSMLSVGPLVLDTQSRIAALHGVPILFSPKEFALLEYLALRQGKPVPRAELEEHLYDERSQVSSNTIDVLIYALRNKLQSAKCPPLIQTRRGFGYLLSAETSK